MIAAIDCGTNTIKLLIGDLPEVAVRETRMVRLGQGVDTTGELADEALARAFAAIDDYAALIAAHPVDRIRFCATSATRDASNGARFAQGVHDRLGVWPEVISGAEEAALAFDGAVRNLRTPPVDPVLAVDIGGGSTELVLGRAGVPEEAASLNIGSVRLTERHLHSDPPSTPALARLVLDIDEHLDRLTFDLTAASTVVGVAGTVTSVAAAVLDLPAFSVEAIDQRVLPLPGVHAAVLRLARLTVAQRLALPYMHPGRADVIIAGAVILDRVLRRTSVETITVSEADILDGIAWSIAPQAGAAWPETPRAVAEPPSPAPECG